MIEKEPSITHDSGNRAAEDDCDAARRVGPVGYELLEEVGAGGMGVVYLARDLAFDREVAIKFLHGRFAADSPVARRFLDEARITGQLQHPAIPPVHHVGTLPDGRPFLVMKLIDGETLAKLLAKEPESRGSHIAAFSQVCQAVAYAHSRSVIHRDLKPANVMVGAFSEVQVMDWGLAKEIGKRRPAEPTGAETSQVTTKGAEPDRTIDFIRGDESTDDRTRDGQTIGTPAYMPPEQARGDVESVDCRSDVFALGGILCNVLIGTPPYTGKTTHEVLRKAVAAEQDDALTRLDACGADVELVSLCKRCLAPNSADRPTDAGEVAEALQAYFTAVEERARQAELALVRAEERRKRRRVQLMLVATMVGLVVAGCVGVALASLWQAAEGARSIAVKAFDGEKTARGEAETAKAAAVKAQANEALARKAVEEERRKLAVSEYGRTMQLARQEWRANNHFRVSELMDRTQPDLHGWEWGFLSRLRSSSLSTTEIGKEGLLNLAMTEDGPRLFTGRENLFDHQLNRDISVWDGSTGASLVKLTGHPFGAWAAFLSPDGSRLVTVGRSRAALVWDMKTGAKLLTINGPSRENGGAVIRTAAWSPDGSRIVTAISDGTVKVWDAQTGTYSFTLMEHPVEVPVLSVSFSPDGSCIVTGNYDGTADVWDAATGGNLCTLKGHTKPVRSASFNANGSRIVTASDDTAKVWDANTGAEVLTLRGHTGGVRSASFSPDGTRIVTASSDTTAKVWDAKTGAEFLTLRGHTDKGGVIKASFTIDGSRVITASDDGIVKTWDANVDAEEVILRGGSVESRFSAFNTDGSLAVSMGPRGAESSATVWDTKSGAELLTLKGHEARVSSASFSPDGSRIVTASDDNTAKVWDTKTGSEVFTLKGHNKPILSAVFSPDGDRIVTGGDESKTIIWDAKTGIEIQTIAAVGSRRIPTSFDADGTRVVTAFDSAGMVSLWDAALGSKLLELEDPDVFIEPEKRPTVIIDAGPFEVKVRDAKTGAWVTAAKPSTKRLHSVAFDSNGARIVTGNSEGAVRIWDAKTGEVERVIRHEGLVFADLTPDGTRVITGSKDWTVKVWDANTGAEHITLMGHTGVMESAAFSPDGSRIVTSSLDGTVKLWHAGTGAELITLGSYGVRVGAVFFSPDGTRILSNGGRIWSSLPMDQGVASNERSNVRFSPDATGLTGDVRR